jgi:hypothetical protein
MTRVGRRVLVALAALAVASAATGCGAIRDTVRTQNALKRAGFRDAGVDWYGEDGLDILEVWWTARAETTEALADESMAAARVVWRVAPIRFDAVRTYPDTPFLGDQTDAQRTFPRSTLEEEFGPRPAGLDRSLYDVLQVGHYLRWAAFGAVLFLSSAALVVWLVLRSSRRGRAAAA